MEGRSSDATDMDQNWVTWRAPPLTTRPLALPAASAAEGWQRQRAQRAPIMCTTADLVTLAASGRRYPCIYADPPWPYGNHATSGAAQKHYECMSIDALCALPIARLAAPDAHLHLWVTNSFLREGLQLLAAWGFDYRSTFVWVKPTIGMGNYWRVSHEFLLTSIRGNAKRFRDHNLRSRKEYPRGEHSAKPEEVRSMLEQASPGPYLELFGRKPAARWAVWGNEIERELLFSTNAA
jgi:N6-adenosine-specific RNA methylase IME4